VTKLRKSARDEECLMESPVCNYNPETTVLCHINSHKFGKGMGRKADDLAGFYGCSCCHDFYDNRMKHNMDKEEITIMALEAVILTHIRMKETGVIK